MAKQEKITVELSPRDRRLLQQIRDAVDTIIARWEKDVPSDVRRLVETATVFRDEVRPEPVPEPPEKPLADCHPNHPYGKGPLHGDWHL